MSTLRIVFASVLTIFRRLDNNFVIQPGIVPMGWPLLFMENMP